MIANRLDVKILVAMQVPTLLWRYLHFADSKALAVLPAVAAELWLLAQFIAFDTTTARASFWPVNRSSGLGELAVDARLFGCVVRLSSHSGRFAVFFLMPLTTSSSDDAIRSRAISSQWLRLPPLMRTSLRVAASIFIVFILFLMVFERGLR